MTEKELSKYYFLKKEIADLEMRIAELGNGLSSTYFDKISVSSSKTISSIQEKIVYLKDALLEKRISALEEYIRIEKYVDNIEDSEIRLMFRLRFLDMKNYEQIARQLNCDRTTASRKIKDYIKVAHKSHSDVR